MSEKVFDKKISLDKGIYTDAANNSQSIVGFLEDLWCEKAEEETPYRGMTNIEIWEQRENLRKDHKPVPKLGLHKMLEANGLKAFGARVDTVDKFFENSNLAVLFPAYIDSVIYSGSIRASIVPGIIARTISIDGLEFKKIYLEDSEETQEGRPGTRGTHIPETTINVYNESVALRKWQRSVPIDYEALYGIPLTLYQEILERIGMRIGVQESQHAVSVLINGDGNANGLDSEWTEETAVSGAVSKDDIIKFSNLLDPPYQINTFVAQKSYMNLWMNGLSNLINPNAQWGVTGMTLPTGRQWKQDALDDYILGIDKNNCLGYVVNDSLNMTERDRIIDKQQVLTVITKRSEFNIFQQSTIGALDVDH